MSAISHFQTYSQRENHVTNNTMLMLRHVYATSPRLLEDVLQALLEEDEVEIGPRFEQQVGAAHSIPDAVLSQKALHIYLEAKHGDGLSNDQIKRHLNSIAEKKHSSNSAFLIGLTKNEINKEDQENWKQQALSHGITFMATSYRELLEVLGSVCGSFQRLQEVFEDFQAFIGGEGLLPDQHRKLAAMLCGQSWQENIRHGVYFEPANRPPKWTRAHFIGSYRQKSVSHVGRIEASAICRKIDDQLLIDKVEMGELSSEQKDRIFEIINAASYYPDLGAEPHRYYLVDHFFETDVRKVSKGGMMGFRYLDIVELTERNLEPGEATEKVAAALAGTSYI